MSTQHWFKSYYLLLCCLLIAGCTTGVSIQETAEVYFNLGNAYFELEKYNEAVKAYTRAIELEESFARASYNLARVYLLSGEVEKGIDVLYQELEQDGDNSVILNTLAYAYTLSGETGKALEIYGQVLQRSQYDENALYNSGMLYWEEQNRQKAVEVFTSLYRINPEDENVLYNLGTLEIELGDNDRGIRFLEEYTKKQAQDSEALMILAKAYEEEKFFSKALDSYEAVIKLDPKIPQAHFRKAYILLTAIGDSENGIKSLDQAILAGFTENASIQALMADPDLVDADRVLAFLDEKGFPQVQAGDDSEEALRGRGGGL